jgi:hypothetical protein
MNEQHNAAVKPPGSICATAKLSMRGLLIPVGFNRLLDRLRLRHKANAALAFMAQPSGVPNG